ncbi:MAG TPA: hypothetical protein VGH65_01005, partial [Verrucomicrobiaceae bacterium]
MFIVLASRGSDTYLFPPRWRREMLSNQNPDPAQLHKAPFVLWRPFAALWNWLVPQSVAHADRQPRMARFVAAGLVLLVCIGAVV